MDRSEMEQLVRKITETVLLRLQNEEINSQIQTVRGSGKVSKSSSTVGQSYALQEKSDGEKVFVDKKLITEADVIGYSKNGVLQIVVPQKIIITPSAQDAIRDRRMVVSRQYGGASSQSSQKKVVGKVAILAPANLSNEKNSIVNLLKDMGIQSESFGNPVDRSVGHLVKKISSGDSQCGIVINDKVFSLCIDANKESKIKGAVCWDEKSARESRAEANTNLLFINPSLIGSQVVPNIVKAWLTG